MIYFTSDWHLGDQSFIDREIRPFKDVDVMEQTILDGINIEVKKDDVLYVLGDVSIGDDNKRLKNFLSQLNVKRKSLIIGNHDTLSLSEYIDAGFESIHSSLILEKYCRFELTLIHDPAVAGCFLEHRFICGHVHRLFQSIGNTINVSCCVWNYAPISITKVNDIFTQNEI